MLEMLLLSLTAMLLYTSMVNGMLELFGRHPANYFCTLTNAYHATNTVLIFEHCTVVGVFKSISE